MSCDNCDNDKMYNKEDPLITIVRNPRNEKFTVALQGWNTPPDADGYNKEEVKELIDMLKTSIYHLNNCWDEHDHDSLFDQEVVDEKIKVNTR